MSPFTTPIPEALERYPRVDATERVALHQWLRSLSSRQLILLLSDRKLEPKLVALRRDQLADGADGMTAKTKLIVGAMACGAIALGIAAVTLFLK